MDRKIIDDVTQPLDVLGDIEEELRKNGYQSETLFRRIDVIRRDLLRAAEGLTSIANEFAYIPKEEEY